MKYQNPILKMFYNNTGHYLDGVRIDNHSMNIFKSANNKFLILIKEYHLGIPFIKNEIIVDDCESAEDEIGSLNFEYGKIVQFRDNVRKIFNSAS